MSLSPMSHRTCNASSTGIEKAGDAEPSLVVLPECMLQRYAYDSREDAIPHAVSIDDPVFAELAQARSQTPVCI